ncbi:MAG: AraC family transcriptional regulator [bacterium]|nr:AraC family transcriptional regulator [bacterium]
MRKFWNKVDIGDNIHSMVKGENGLYLGMRNETGEGSMTCYDIFPGAVFMYCDYHMEFCESRFKSKGDLLCIDYCIEGSFENEIKKDVFTYQKEKELNINTRKYHSGKFIFPQRHFHGITICFSIPEADQSLSEIFQGINVSITELKQKFCSKSEICIIKATEELQHFFMSIVSIPELHRIEYMRIKVAELLLQLKTLRIEDCFIDVPYIHKTELQKIKAVREKMVENISRFYTIEELSGMFGISQTALKNEFKILYGKPIYAYMKQYRMNLAAAILLEQPQQKIAQVAAVVGYDNASKFSAAFSKVMGMTPIQYRRKEKSYQLNGL